MGRKNTYSQVYQDKPHHVSINNLKEFPSLQKKYSALHVEQDGSPVEVNDLDHSSSHLPQQRLNPGSSSQKTNLHSMHLPKSFLRLVVGQPTLKIAENQQLLTSINLASFENLKEKVVSSQHTVDVEMPQSITRIEAT